MMSELQEPAIQQLASQSHYKFNDVLEKFDLKPYILRFWESEFEQISPIVSDSGQKIYTPSDLYFIKIIKDLLLIKKLPIQKAKLMIDRKSIITPGTSINSSTAKPVEIRRFKKSLYSKSRAQMELNQIRHKLQMADEKIRSIKERYNWI